MISRGEVRVGVCSGGRSQCDGGRVVGVVWDGANGVVTWPGIHWLVDVVHSIIPYFY